MLISARGATFPMMPPIVVVPRSGYSFADQPSKILSKMPAVTSWTERY